ncbi:hypothetical protein [Allonocardiopsis opalescens]|uniref:hypothetical protein n=1 Tax=Allonocardiopsis opalescens TaxID=1144618 RepID=UPI0011B24E15|nr:hypothetical protein [Allonocardiopsis opalescens]
MSTRGLVLDRTWYDQELDAACDTVSDGHPAAGAVLLAAGRDDHERRALRAEGLGRAGRELATEVTALAVDTDDDTERADLLLWLGWIRIAAAWHGTLDAERGGTPLDLAKLGDALTKAEEPLRTAARLLPDDPVPWVGLLWWALGSGADDSVRDELWAEVQRRAPSLYAGHVARLHSLSPRYGGSPERMFAFAWETVQQAPEGDPLPAVLPLAHADHLLSQRAALLAAGKARRAQRFASTYFNARMIRELETADRKWRLNARPHPRYLEAHHLFAWAFIRAGNIHAARWHMRWPGERAATVPWGYEGDPAAHYAVARDAVLNAPGFG